MYEVEKSLFSDGQYNLGTSTSSLKKGEKNSLQKKDMSNYSCLYGKRYLPQCSKNVKIVQKHVF